MLKGAHAPALHRGLPILGVTSRGRLVFPIAGGDGSTEPVVDLTRFATVEDLQSRLSEISEDMQSFEEEFRGQRLDDDAQGRWDALDAERQAVTDAIAKIEERVAKIRGFDSDPNKRVEGEDRSKQVQATRTRVPEDVYDLGAYDRSARSFTDKLDLMRDGAKKAIEAAVFPDGVDVEAARGHIEHLLDTIDEPNLEVGKAGGELAQRILATGNPLYRSAFGKYLKHGNTAGMTPEEQRALSVGTGSAGGFAVVYTLDPTIVPSSNFSVNPWRALARTEQIAGTNEWKAVTSGAITAAYAAEATEASDNAPTLAQPDIIVEKAQAYVPFSIEIGQDWPALQTEMAGLLQDAKDDLEATKFALGAGHGSQEPKGIITAATSTVTAGGSGAFAIADVYKLFEALPARFRPRSKFVANLFTIDKVRQFDTSGGSGVWMGPQGLQPAADTGAAGTTGNSVGVPLLGRQLFESTAMDAVLTTGSKIVLVGDFRYFVIVDRVGMNVEVMPLVVGTNHRPTGQRGLYAYWRNSSDVLSAAAFRVLVTG